MTAAAASEVPTSLFRLSADEVLSAYDRIWPLYPHVPSMTMWRAWEVAAYQRYADALAEPVLDVGCGDGRFFRLVYPDVGRVSGVDLDPDAVAAARASGVYADVRQAPAHALPFGDGTFGGAFANCSLEHMARLGDVLDEVYRTLRPGARFVFSVVTEKFVDWAPLPLLVEKLGLPAAAEALRAGHVAYHHLANPLSARGWAAALARAGFEQIEHTPIMPNVSSRVFLGLDQLWHVPAGAAGGEGAEVGAQLHAWLARLPKFPTAFRRILEGLLEMEIDPYEGCGAVFAARRRA